MVTFLVFPVQTVPAAKRSFLNRTEDPESHTATPNTFQS